jgi:hypothetical protein
VNGDNAERRIAAIATTGNAKSAPDPAPYPLEWTAKQRTTAYWFAIRKRHLPSHETGWIALLDQAEREFEKHRRIRDQNGASA